MNDYIATFYSHFGALTFCKQLSNIGIPAKPSPVPRSLSSSCGTCVKFTAETPPEFSDEDMEALYSCEKNEYVLVIKN